MNIALCVEAYKPYTNGVITHISMLRDSLIKKGHSCLIITSDPTIKHHTLVDGVLRCPAIAMKNIYGYGISAPISKSRVRALRDFKPDVIHIHTELSIGVFALMFAKMYNIPICYTLHTMYEDYSHYLFKNKITLKAMRPAGCAYFRNFAKGADLSMSSSEKAIDFFKEIGAKDKEIHILPNTIDTESFNPDNFTDSQIAETREELGIASTDFVGIFVGRLGEEKSVDVLINGWSSVLGKSKGHKLVIVGSGPCESSLKSQAAKLSKNIIFTGKIDHSNIAKYFAFSNYYITASLTEMMSISMLEAMAMGLPCILRKDEKNISQITEGENGFIRDTAEEMAEVAQELSTLTLEEYKYLKHCARQHALSLSCDKEIDKIVELYKKTIEIHQNKPSRIKRLKLKIKR